MPAAVHYGAGGWSLICTGAPDAPIPEADWHDINIAEAEND
jgi:hypothetical protein